MKEKILSVAVTATLLALSPAQAWANPQHERMRQCNQEAKEQTLKGEARKEFMRTCLKARKGTPAEAQTEKKANAAESAATPAAEPRTVAAARNERMKECNRSATEKTLKGAERKSFISECLKS